MAIYTWQSERDTDTRAHPTLSNSLPFKMYKKQSLCKSERERYRKMTMTMKHLSSIANDVVRRCAEQLGTSVEELVEEFEVVWRPENGNYARKLVEYCSGKALNQKACPKLEEKIDDGSFSRFTFDMMLAWEKPNSADVEFRQVYLYVCVCVNILC